MSAARRLWSKLLLVAGRVAAGKRRRTSRATAMPQPLPGEPHVFECQSCGKVFDATQRRALCPECDSPDVSLLTE
jgi:Zn finger protein HypA/HybF involved in hydrogenase expression